MSSVRFVGGKPKSVYDNGLGMAAEQLSRSQMDNLIKLLEDNLFFFFFQAEDGIRDLTVTGVQTCALPICSTTREPVCQSVARAATNSAATAPTCTASGIRNP